MILYHGSTTKGIKILEPRLADHDCPYIYLTTIDVVAAFYLCNAVERPFYWFPYGFRNGNMQVPVYDELYPNALREVSEGVSGCIYRVEVETEQVLPFKNIPCARLSKEPLKVLDSIYVPNAYQLFLDYERQGKMKVSRFEEKTPQELQWYYDSIKETLRTKQMNQMPMCSYALFIKKKFPFVWEQYMQEQKK